MSKEYVDSRTCQQCGAQMAVEELFCSSCGSHYIDPALIGSTQLVVQNAVESEMVRAEQIIKCFGDLTVLNGVDLSVKRGQVVVIIGPSGSGKTTSLRCINHLEKIDGGRIYIEGQLMGDREQNGRLIEDSEANIAHIRSQIGFVFQRFNLFPHLTALENIIEAPIHVLHQPRAEIGRAH